MNASVDVNALRMTVTLRGLDVVWAARRRIVVPLGHVRGARHDAHAASHGPWLAACASWRAPLMWPSGTTMRRRVAHTTSSPRRVTVMLEAFMSTEAFMP